MSMPALLIINETSHIWRKGPQMVIRNVNGHSMLHHFGLPGAHILPYIPTDFVVKMLPTKFLATSALPNRMSHMALLLFASTLTVMLRLFKAFSMVSLLTSINVLILTSVVSRKTVLVATTSSAECTVRSPLPGSKFSVMILHAGKMHSIFPLGS